MDESDGAKVEATPKQKNWFSAMALWKKVVLVVAAVFVALVLIVNMATSAPVKVSNEFLNDVQAANSSAAYALMSTAAQQTVTQADFKAIIDKIGPILNTKETMKSKTVSGETGTSAKAEVIYNIKGTDGTSYVFTENLTKDNGVWKVLNFDSEKQ